MTKVFINVLLIRGMFARIFTAFKKPFEIGSMFHVYRYFKKVSQIHCRCSQQRFGEKKKNTHEKSLQLIGNVFPPKYPCILHIHPSIYPSILSIWGGLYLSACQTVGLFLLSSKALQTLSNCFEVTLNLWLSHEVKLLGSTSACISQKTTSWLWNSLSWPEPPAQGVKAMPEDLTQST